MAIKSDTGKATIDWNVQKYFIDLGFCDKCVN